MTRHEQRLKSNRGSVPSHRVKRPMWDYGLPSSRRHVVEPRKIKPMKAPTASATPVTTFEVCQAALIKMPDRSILRQVNGRVPIGCLHTLGSSHAVVRSSAEDISSRVHESTTHGFFKASITLDASTDANVSRRALCGIDICTVSDSFSAR